MEDVSLTEDCPKRNFR